MILSQMQRHMKKERVKRISCIGKEVSSIKEITEQFDCGALTVLNLHSNSIATFDGLSGLLTLKELNLSANFLGRLEGFPVLRQLETLNLANNGLVSCDGIPFLPRLRVLILTHNRLESIQGLRAFERGQLSRLDLRGNKVNRQEVITLVKNVTSLKDVVCDEQDVVAEIPQRHVVHAADSIGADSTPSYQEKETKLTSQFVSPESKVSQSFPKAVETEKHREELLRISEKSDNDCIAVGYPVSLHKRVFADRATNTDPEDDRHKRVKKVNRAISTRHEEIEKRSASVLVDLQSNETLLLQKTIGELQSEITSLEGDMAQRQQKQQSVETEFLSKIKAMRESYTVELQEHKKQTENSERQLRESYDRDIAKFNAQLSSNRLEIKSLKTLSRKLHSEIERVTQINKDLTAEKAEQTQRAEEREKTLQAELEAKSNENEQTQIRLSEKLAVAEEQLKDNAATIANLEESLSKTSQELNDLQEQTHQKALHLKATNQDLNSTLEKTTSRLEQLQSVEASLNDEIATERQMRQKEKETFEKEIAELERRFESKLAEEKSTAFLDGENKGREQLDKRLREETNRLRINFESIEIKFKEAQKKCEMRNTVLISRLKQKQERLGELGAALVVGRERSQQQEQIMKEMHRVIDEQKLTIQSLKQELHQLSTRLKSSRLQSLEEEVLSLRLKSREIEGLKDQLSTAETEAKVKEKELQQLKAENVQQNSALIEAQNQTRRLRAKNSELTKISDRLHNDKNSQQDVIKIKEKMLDSANNALTDLKEELKENVNETSELKQTLKETEEQLVWARNEIDEKRERLTCETEKWKNAVEREQDRVKSLEEKLSQKSEMFSSIESEIVHCKARYDERFRKLEDEKRAIAEKLEVAMSDAQTSKSAQKEAETKQEETQKLYMTECAQKDALHKITLKLRLENEQLNKRALDVDADMKRLVASIDKERSQSAEKIQRIEEIMSDLRTPFSKYR